MFRLWFYYTQLAFRDLTRMWSGTQHHVIIVAGICLPILLLLGLKQGHVADLRRDLLTSPTGRQIVFWSAQQGELLDKTTIAKLEQELPSVQLIIPGSQRLVRLSNPSSPDETNPHFVTFYSTRPGDPMLALSGGDVLTVGQRGVVLTDSIAKSLGVSNGGQVILSLERERSGVIESVSTKLDIAAVVDLGKEATSIAYGEIGLIDSLEQYVRGFGVPEFAWPAMKVPVRDRYGSYLLYTERSNDLGKQDREALNARGLKIETITEPELKSLFGLIKDAKLNDLNLYCVYGGSSRTDPNHRLALSPSDISELTTADDVVIPWNVPEVVTVAGLRHRLVGLSLPKRTWLRAYMKSPECAFDYDAKGHVAWVVPSKSTSDTLDVPLDERTVVRFAVTNGTANVKDAPQVPLSGDKPTPSDNSARAPEPEKSTDTAPKHAVADGATHGPPNSSGTPDLVIEQAARENSIAADNAPEKSEADLPAADSRSEGKESGAKEQGSGQGVHPGTTKDDAPPPAAKTLGDSPPDRSTLEPDRPTSAVSSVKIEPEISSRSEHLTPPNEAPIIVVLPADLFAQIDAYRTGSAVYDAAINLFVATPEKPVYDKARLYVETIDEVPQAVAALIDRNFVVMSESSRITEIHKQDASLQLLVLVVGAGVFVFGVITVVSVLLDSTDRKRGAIGIMRVMGLPRSAIFYMIILRAIAIGLLAGIVAVVCGYLIAMGLAYQVPSESWLSKWKPTVAIILDYRDIIIVFLGALACSGIGSLIPAWKASRMDPFDAIVEGRFR